MLSFAPKSCIGRGIPKLPTATSWYDTGVDSFLVGAHTQTDVVVTISRPTIINIETNTATRIDPVAAPVRGNDASRSESSGRQPTTGTQADTVGLPKTFGQHVGIGTDGRGTSSTLTSNSQQTEQSGLLLDVVSKLGETLSSVQESQLASLMTDGSGQPIRPTSSDSGSALSQLPVTPSQRLSSGTDTTSLQTIVSVDGTITIGSEILTLTPGLSATVGPASDATFLGLATDINGNTLVTISSSGIAITATVSNVPATVSLPKTGFEASITAAARPGDYATRTNSTSSTTRAVGVGGRSEMGWWTNVVLGVVGIGLLL